MFRNRYDAAQQLLEQLKNYKNNPQVVVIAIPRGGLELGYILAQGLNVPLDIRLVKKIGAPGHSELAIGAVSHDDVFIDPRFTQFQEYINEEILKIRSTLETREQQYRAIQKPINLHNKIVIVTDDGIATGQTLKAALQLIKKSNPQKLILAVPVATQDSLEEFEPLVDEIVCLITPKIMYGISQFYEHFDQVEDSKALELLKKANA